MIGCPPGDGMMNAGIGAGMPTVPGRGLRRGRPLPRFPDDDTNIQLKR